MTKATGRFDVTLTPQPPEATFAAVDLPRMLIEKSFAGDLIGSSKGQMVAAMTPVEGSAGYVALERVTGTLDGRHGTFALQHSSTMNRGVPQQSITVVPDSGTEELIGLAGSMVIHIVEGDHRYIFDYTLGTATTVGKIEIRFTHRCRRLARRWQTLWKRTAKPVIDPFLTRY
ncbi:MAG: DUF3224 domain-containing protein [Caldilineaceae bacterium]